MSISSSLNAGVSGLNANANKLATISDNIANSQTYGYKRADVDFASMAVSDSRSPYTAGGGRWYTAGGVRTNAIWDIGAKGALVAVGLGVCDVVGDGGELVRVRVEAGDAGVQ